MGGVLGSTTVFGIPGTDANASVYQEDDLMSEFAIPRDFVLDEVANEHWGTDYLHVPFLDHPMNAIFAIVDGFIAFMVVKPDRSAAFTVTVNIDDGAARGEDLDEEELAAFLDGANEALDKWDALTEEELLAPPR